MDLKSRPEFIFKQVRTIKFQIPLSHLLAFHKCLHTKATTLSFVLFWPVSSHSKPFLLHVNLLVIQANRLFMIFLVNSYDKNYGIIVVMVIKNVNKWTIGFSTCWFIHANDELGSSLYSSTFPLSRFILCEEVSESSFSPPSSTSSSTKLRRLPGATIANSRNVQNNSYLIDWNDFQWNSYFLTTMSYK